MEKEMEKEKEFSRNNTKRFKNNMYVFLVLPWHRRLGRGIEG
jgi:hypothetical protein